MLDVETRCIASLRRNQKLEIEGPLSILQRIRHFLNT